MLKQPTTRKTCFSDRYDGWLLLAVDLMKRESVLASKPSFFFVSCLFSCVRERDEKGKQPHVINIHNTKARNAKKNVSGTVKATSASTHLFLQTVLCKGKEKRENENQ